MKSACRIIIVIQFLIFLAGCSINNEKLPGTDLLLQDMNHDIELLPNPGGENGPKNGDIFILKVSNLSDQRIIFPGDYGLKLFFKKGEDWIVVENKNHSPDGQVILPLADKFPPGRIVGAIPFIPDLDQPVTLRVAVVGHTENNENNAVGAYVDVVLEP